MTTFVSGWYLIYTKPRSEKKVADRLLLGNIEVFLPTAKTLRNWTDRRKLIEAPLFPSYVFVYLRELQDYYVGLNAEGVLYYVRLGKEIARVADTVVQNLKTFIEKGMNLEVSAQHFKPSQAVAIKKGPLAGLSCEVVRYKDREKVLVRLSLLNRCVLADVEVDQLIAI